MDHYSVQFEDSDGNRLTACADRRWPGVWRVYFLYRLAGTRSATVGAYSRHDTERAAKRELDRLEAWAKAKGWKLRVVLTRDLTPPAPMGRDTDGARLFRDHATGEYRRDESSFHPLAGVERTPLSTEWTEFFAPVR